jgi:hypothetical protein
MVRLRRVCHPVSSPGFLRPPHKAVRAACLHTASTLVFDGEALVGPRMLDARAREPLCDQLRHVWPRFTGSLAASLEREKEPIVFAAGNQTVSATSTTAASITWSASFHIGLPMGYVSSVSRFFCPQFFSWAKCKKDRKRRQLVVDWSAAGRHNGNPRCVSMIFRVFASKPFSVDGAFNST